MPIPGQFFLFKEMQKSKCFKGFWRKAQNLANNNYIKLMIYMILKKF